MQPLNPLPPLPSERLIIDAIETRKVTLDVAHCERALVVSPGRAQAAVFLREHEQIPQVVTWYVDSFRASSAQLELTQRATDVTVVCSPDLPEETFQLALVPLLRTGETEMSRDVLQQAHQQLAIGGMFIASVNHPQDHWLMDQMQVLFGDGKQRGAKIHGLQFDDGWVYVAKKLEPLKRARSFDAEFAMRDGDQLLRIFSRPSVFSHRSVDPAARKLIRASEIRIGDRVLDLGCGNGAVALASAAQSETGTVFAIDSNTRAVQSARRGAEANELSNMEAIVNHDGRFSEPLDCDWALLNPPYYGDFGIADHFMRTASASLVAGGRAVVVTKQALEYEARHWSGLRLESVIDDGGYQLLTYRKT